MCEIQKRRELQSSKNFQQEIKDNEVESAFAYILWFVESPA